MPVTKTQPTGLAVEVFLNTIPDPHKRADCWTITQVMMEAAQAKPEMWGTSIVGFGRYRAINTEGKEEYWMLIGFSPRKRAIALYLMLGSIEHTTELLARLGKYTHGKGCLYIKRLADVDLAVLKELLRASVADKIKPNPVPGS